MKQIGIYALGLLLTASVHAQRWGGELRFSLRADPKTFDPAAVLDDSSETIRFLTGGVLLRVNRKTQALEPELAKTWQVSKDGRRITFELRPGITFSDGTPFTAEHVAFTMKRLMDPALASATGDAFRSGSGAIQTQVHSAHRISILFPAPVAGLARLFDQVAIVKEAPTGHDSPVLGPYIVKAHRPGVDVVLARNPRFWKTSNGRPLPYIDSIRLVILQNREIELDRFLKKELDLINTVEPPHFRQLRERLPSQAVDAGASLESEMIWFNQVPSSPLPIHKKKWFENAEFRRAVSEAINRDDICRLVYLQYAQPAAGPVSPANREWYAPGLKPHPYDVKRALARLQGAGFKLEGKELRDAAGNKVEFSLVTNSGNTVRARIAALLQQDLARIGIRMNIIALDFPSLISRITQSSDYEACLLGLINVDLDPNGQMNVWLSSGANHPWNPKQAKAATIWEAEIDNLMRRQAASIDERVRRDAFAAVQRIVSEQAPILYLANNHALCAVSARVHGAQPVPLTPRTYWNIETLWLAE